MQLLLEKIKRVAKKPPKLIAQRVLAECRTQLDRFVFPRKLANFSANKLFAMTKTVDMSSLWIKLSQRSYLCSFDNLTQEISAANRDDIFHRAQQALANQVDLLGSGLIHLGNDIAWTCDYKTGHLWKPDYFKDIDYNLKNSRCDVKFPWELSRMQWMIPVGQAYHLTGDEKYAQFVKDTLLDWVQNNPVAHTVNWSCTMEVAMRIMVWTWFFHIFKRSQAWQDEKFREIFLISLHVHGLFTQRYIEISDINGNHLTADAAALVFAGCFWGDNQLLSNGWTILEREIQLQITEDGVDFEASVPYHRLVLELFFLAARYRLCLNLPVSQIYQERLISMANYTAVYSRPDGSIPLLGDADDARVLPFGEQALNDHRYLMGWVGLQFESEELLSYLSGSTSELLWLFGKEILRKIPENPVKPTSTYFEKSGMVVLRNDVDHVFIDCASVGLANRGGHGHNDCLSFSAMLNGSSLITDSGAYVYTADYEKRNQFRSTAYHNTPCVDGEEINRFIHPDYLWNLHYDAIPEVLYFKSDEKGAEFQGQHQGYMRLSDPVLVKRNIKLDHMVHALYIEDMLLGKDTHFIEIPLHFEVGSVLDVLENQQVLIKAVKEDFILSWTGTDGWEIKSAPCYISPRYGVQYKSVKLCWTNQMKLPANLKISIFRKE